MLLQPTVLLKQAKLGMFITVSAGELFSSEEVHSSVT